MHSADLTTDAAESPATARNHLSGLLSGLVARTPGALDALLGTNDGLKLAFTHASLDTADAMAAAVSSLISVGRTPWHDSSGRVRQVVVEHDDGHLFVMSTGTMSGDGLSTVLGVLTTPEADPGQVGHEMATLITGLDEHLVTRARRNTVG
ncbi:roadblock/LC7 domain-containing protein [Streptomyces sp. NPDC001553]|uniref:roadblock/LC7 domain-containing protein n=1 Tax=Streptomyces sp. NPDC001553 TaxID=3154385 RepID=UPI00331F626F